ncbi:hypothetical protein J4558_00010 [Leptolyngbya sp. 15MV]|nr:hypothetical protein J4558_00010 [Leptolyngbya sp. 15MV]
MVITPDTWTRGEVRISGAPLWAEIVQVFRNLRPEDRREIAALHGHVPAEAAAETVLAHQERAMVLRGGAPVAVMFSHPIHPGMWGGGLVSTLQWPLVVGPVTRWIRDIWLPRWAGLSGARRMQMMALADHSAVAWMTRLLHGRLEGTLRGMGRGGEDMVVVAWSAEDVQLGSGRRHRDAVRGARERGGARRQAEDAGQPECLAG